MGYRKVPTIYELEFEEEELRGLVVKMRSLRVGRIRKLMVAFEKDEDPTGEQLGEIFKLLEEGLVSWNLEDEFGTPVPTDMSGINELEMDLMLAITRAWLEGMTGVSDDLGKDSGAGGTSRTPLPPMEAL